MSKDILDEIEKNTGPRTCPECGHQFPFGVFVRRYVASYGLSKWPCHGCGELIKCDYIKFQVVWLVGLIVSAVIFGVLISFFDLHLPIFVFLIANLVYVILTFYYVKFEKYN